MLPKAILTNVNSPSIAESLYCIMANVLDCDIVVSEFELQVCYYIHVWTNTLGKGMNPLILLVVG